MSSYFFSYRIEGKMAHFDEHEVRHLKVMRILPPSQVKFTDGKGRLYLGHLVTMEKATSLDVLQTQEPPPFELGLILSPVRWERTRYAVEKAVELGVTRIYLWNTERTTRRKTENKMLKSSLVVRDAMKQCGSFYLPSVLDFERINFSDFQTKLLLDIRGDELLKNINIDGNVLVAIGPEGGFTHREKEFLTQKGFVSVRLGRRTLRSETSVVAVLTLVDHLKGVL